MCYKEYDSAWVRSLPQRVPPLLFWRLRPLKINTNDDHRCNKRRGGRSAPGGCNIIVSRYDGISNAGSLDSFIVVGEPSFLALFNRYYVFGFGAGFTGNVLKCT